jgi:hypothetical protein
MRLPGVFLLALSSLTLPACSNMNNAISSPSLDDLDKIAVAYLRANDPSHAFKENEKSVYLFDAPDHWEWQDHSSHTPVLLIDKKSLKVTATRPSSKNVYFP